MLLHMLDIRNLGRCPACMKASFVFSCMAGAVALADNFSAAYTWHALLATAVALGGISLWLMHVVLFAQRAAGLHNEAVVGEEPGITRRSTLSAFAGAFAFAAFSISLPAFARITGLPAGIMLYSCCYKGCGGACCRCGSASGYQSDCSSSCSIGLEELKRMPALRAMPALIVTGRLIDARRGSGLNGEKVEIIAPGGGTYSATSSADGSFKIMVPGTGKPANVAVGNLLSEASGAAKNNAEPYTLFLKKA